MCSNAAVLVARSDCLSCTIGAINRLWCVVESVDEGLQDPGQRLGCWYGVQAGAKSHDVRSNLVTRCKL